MLEAELGLGEGPDSGCLPILFAERVQQTPRLRVGLILQPKGFIVRTEIFRHRPDDPFDLNNRRGPGSLALPYTKKRSKSCQFELRPVREAFASAR